MQKTANEIMNNEGANESRCKHTPSGFSHHSFEEVHASQS